MAKGGSVKTTFSFNKLSRKLAATIATSINELGKQVNKTIGTNLVAGKDINDKPFKKLKKSTMEIREREGWGTKPLSIGGKLEKRKATSATVSKPVYTIEMTGKGRKGYIYGSLHTQKGGYTTAEKSAIPGKKVPQRNWFGVPKSCKPGGVEWKKMVARVHLLNKIAWRK